LRELSDSRADFVTRHRPAAAVEICHDLSLEFLMEFHGLLIVAKAVREQRQRKLGRAAPSVTPLETRGTVVPQVEAGIERATIDGDNNAVAFPSAFVEFHAGLLSGDGMTEPLVMRPVLFPARFPEGESGCLRLFRTGTLRLRISISELAEIRNLAGEG